MFEEGQLYSPVTAGEDGEVTVHLAHDHPGANDPAYRARRNEIATAALRRLTGEATHRLRDDENLVFLSKVFWFSVEFGVVVEDGELRAYGAGILSSYGEIEEFRDMEHRPLDLVEMGTADYDITAYQPVLYRADSMDEIREVVGGFFATCTDESISELRSRRRARVTA